MKKKIFISQLDWISICIIVLFAITLLFELFKFSLVNDVWRNEKICSIIKLGCGGIAAILLMIKSGIRLFGKPQKWLYLLPCLLVAINNFQWISYYNGRMQFVRTGTIDVVLFALYCCCVGMFEECVFRGIVFSVLASYLTKDKKGFIKTYIISSCIFSISHFFNVFAGAGFGATVMQVGYTLLTGGLFGFVLIKSKNIFCCALIHAIYNFCGTLLSNDGGLGMGAPIDLGTGIMMAIIGVLVGVFVLYKVFTYETEEQCVLYEKLGVKM